MASFLRYARQHYTKISSSASTAAGCVAFVSSSLYVEKLCRSELTSNITSCEVIPAFEEPSTQETNSKSDQKKKNEQQQTAGMCASEMGDYHALFPKRQLWVPRLEYPLWDKDWDGKQPESTGNAEEDRKRMRHLRKTGTTKHIILIRHGQYDESSKEDEKRLLTPLGRLQAEATGKRLAEMLKGAEDDFGPCNIKVVRVSNLSRAKETADIIASYLPDVERSEPDPRLNEGRPCHSIPGGKASEATIMTTDDHHGRIEKGFREYFHRITKSEEVDKSAEDDTDESKDEKPKHEFEIIVGHANVIRYFVCRALQLPPEAWLRLCTFNCSLTYLTIRPTGTVSCRMLGDVGHLPYNLTTFSGHHGFNW